MSEKKPLNLAQRLCPNIIIQKKINKIKNQIKSKFKIEIRKKFKVQNPKPENLVQRLCIEKI